MDYDNDGILDFISGSYDPGDIYLFRGEGKGVYAKVEKILDRSGLPVVHHPEEFAKYQKLKDDSAADEQERITAQVASFGSWVAPVDWDADGDLDLLIGSFAGDLFLRINEGSREQPIYDTTCIPVEANGKPLHVNMHAAPVVADWNDDGLWDLVVGSADGAVGWFGNIGTKTKAMFGPYQQLVSRAADSKFFEQNLGPNDTPTHGVRAQICVTDYNHDGRLDLIVGDYSDVNWKRNLNEAKQAKFDDLMGIQTRMIARAEKLHEAFYANQEDEQLKQQLEQLQQEFEKLDRKKKAFLMSSERASFIWLFLRKDRASSETSSQAERSEEEPSPNATKSKRQPVTMEVTLLPIEGLSDQLQLTVELAIAPEWYIYSDVSDGSPMKTMAVQLELPDGVHVVGEWKRPSGLPHLNDPSTKIYSGRATLTRSLRITNLTGDQSIRINVDYQACNEKFCLPPAVLQETITIQR